MIERDFPLCQLLMVAGARERRQHEERSLLDAEFLLKPLDIIPFLAWADEALA